MTSDAKESTRPAANDPNRRSVVLGLGAAFATAGVRAERDPVRVALDAAVDRPPAEALARLAAFDLRALSPTQRLDLVTARAGLSIDAQLTHWPSRGRQGGYRPLPDARPIAERHYALLLARALGPANPRAAQARLTRELAALHARAAVLFDGIGLSRGHIGARYSALWHDTRDGYRDAPDAVADMARLLTAARRRVPATIGAVPDWCIDVDIRSLSPEEMAAGRNGYRIVPTPTERGGYIVDLRRLSDRPRWTMPSVVAHELLPGHMIQLGMEGMAPPHPLRIAYAASFVEGWGIHAETLAAQDGAFGDPRAMLGHLHWLIFRVGRALVDIGIHCDGWSRDEARARLTTWQGEPAYFAPFDMELTRIAQEPSSRVAEALAWLAIADAAAGRRGARRIAFHQRVLTHGRMRTDRLRDLA